MAGRALALYPRRVLWCCLRFRFRGSVLLWFCFHLVSRHQPHGETTNNTLMVADEDTNPAKLPCRRAVGSS
jgi:hypothetical protein